MAESLENRPLAPGTKVRESRHLEQAKTAYFYSIVVFALSIALVSFVRDRGQLLSNISFWLFLIPFAVSLWRGRAGFLCAVFLLLISPSIHEQFNVLAGTKLHAWAYPAVDCCLGFLAAWTLKGGLGSARRVLERFPNGLLLLFHAWLALSAMIAVARNIWQSASELSLRGLAYNVWLTRGISWHDDYYPLQDPFFYSVALAMLFGTSALLQQFGYPLLRRLVGVVLAGALANVVFALWQNATWMGWVNGHWSVNANALWPDLHSFGVFMAAALGLSCGLLLTRGASRIVWLYVLAAAIGLYLSGSRSTVLLVLAVLMVWALSLSFKLRGWRCAIPLVAAVAVLIAVHWTLVHGYRGTSYASIGKLNMSATSVNLALSYRPEIWAAALGMYFAFPFFGLGQGAFYRLSAVPEFSRSEFLIRMAGEGVHNELLRILVELGPVGVGIVLLIAIPFIRLGRQNFQLGFFYALVGVALGSVYTNALLVRELLIFCAVCAGGYFWEVQTVSSGGWRLPAPATTRYAAIALSTLALAALIEVTMSFGRFPFTYGQRCLEVHPLAKDGWTEGILRVPVPPGAMSAELAVLADRPDLARRPLTLDLSILTGNGSALATQRHTFAQRDVNVANFHFLFPESSDGTRFLELRPSNCYVPLNLGITYDPRRLGVRVKELRFRTAAGDVAS